MNRRVKSFLLVLSIFVISVATIASYAYFTASIGGNATASNTVIVTGYMEVTFENGNVVGTTSNMLPGDYVTLTFSVRNTGTVDTAYDIYLNDVINDFANKSDLVYELISSEGYNINQTTCPETNTKIASNVAIGVGQTHNYTLKITFKETNSNQDNNKGKTFSTKVELEENNDSPTNGIVSFLTDLKNNGATDLEYDGVATLGEEGTIDNNLRYVGSDANNYVYFNCTTTNPSLMNDETCEKWRIVGVFNNIEDENGNSASRIKIMRDDSLGNYSWDDSVEEINQGWGINQWGASTYEDGTPYEGADLMRELNTDYLGNITVGTDGKWYTHIYNSGTDEVIHKIDMPTTTLNQNAQNMIQTVKWNLGAREGYYDVTTLKHEYSTWTAKNFYVGERSNNNPDQCKNMEDYDNVCNDTVVRTTTWIGKIALIYTSDFAYSIKPVNGLSRNVCLDYNNTSYTGDCITSSWIIKIDYLDNFLSPSTTMNYWTDCVAYTGSSISGAGYWTSEYHGFDITTSDGYASQNGGVRPALFLKNEVSIASGEGTSSNPYKLTISN